MEKRDFQLIEECIKMLENTLVPDMSSEAADEVVRSVVAILKIVIKTTDKP